MTSKGLPLGNTNVNESLTSKKSHLRKRVENLQAQLPKKGDRSVTPNSGSELDNQENTSKRQKTNSTSDQFLLKYRFQEVERVKQIRRRTFSHWPRGAKPSAEELTAAGFFACSVGDRVICVYCNLICQQWLGNTDDPIEVHKTLSPRCPFVLSMLIYPVLSSTIILNDMSADNPAHLNEIVYTKPCHESYNEITRREASFASWSEQSAPSIESFVRAGFFYTGVNNIVTCFYCNGSLQNWTATDNPMVEHARWFGHCPYAKQLCGEELYQKIQEANRARQERERVNVFQTNSSQGLLQINDQSMLSRLVAARLDLSNSQRLLDQPFKLSVIKRCWEDQLQVKKDDFENASDLFTACTILQKQIDHIQGNKDNIVIPSVRMKLIREQGQTDLAPSTTSSDISNNESIQMESTNSRDSEEQAKKSASNSTNTSTLTNPCIICFQEEKHLACLPCGHLSACVPCSHSLRTCPVCRRSIEAFVRVYI